MSSENLHSQAQSDSQSPSQSKSSLAHHRSSNSIHTNYNDSGPASPTLSQHGKPPKAQKHIAHHHSSSRVHTRVPSNKGLHKLTKTGNDGSQDFKQNTNLKRNQSATALKKNLSTTSLKKNSSQGSLKRNRSSGEVHKRPKSSNGEKKKQAQKAASVRFEIGEQEDAWESSSASPALSRAPSRSGQSSTKHSASNSEPQSPTSQSVSKSAIPSVLPANGSRSHTADAKIIMERLLQRTPSHNTTTTKMSLATATPTGHSPDSLDKTAGTTLNGTPKIGSKEDMISRFVGGSDTPSENSPFLYNHHRKLQELSVSKHDEVKRAQSMGNLTRLEDEEEDSALAPRSRKSSTTHAYNPPQQSRTQQKLWLQRASSNIEPTQMAPGVAMNGLGLHNGFGSTPLVGAGPGYDGKDPRIRLQLERTGLEYMVVRRHQDPIALSLKRLNLLPGAEKHKRIPTNTSPRKSNDSGRYSVRGTRSGDNGLNGSYDGSGCSQGDENIDTATDEDSVDAILRSLWEKSYDLTASTD